MTTTPIKNTVACLSTEQIQAYISATLQPAEEYALELHMEACALCRDAVEGALALAATTPLSGTTSPAPRFTAMPIRRLAAVLLPLLLVGASLYFYLQTNDSTRADRQLTDLLRTSTAVRGGASGANAQLSVAAQLFASGKTAESNQVMQQLINEQATNYGLKLEAAKMYLQWEQPQSAIDLLKDVRINDTLLFEEATYLLALTALQQGDKAVGIPLLEELLSRPESFYAEKAKDLLQK